MSDSVGSLNNFINYGKSCPERATAYHREPHCQNNDVENLHLPAGRKVNPGKATKPPFVQPSQRVLLTQVVCGADSQKAKTPSGNEQDNQGYADITERPCISYAESNSIITLHLLIPNLLTGITMRSLKLLCSILNT